MSNRKGSGETCDVKLTAVQRRALAGAAPELAPLLKLGEANQRTVHLTVAQAELAIKKAEALLEATRGAARNTLLHIIDAATLARRAWDAAHRAYQFKVTLVESRPPIWRRIVVPDCTLDELHEYIQSAMGWTNSHLHQFVIGGRYYADPTLMEESFDERADGDSTKTMLSDIIPEGRKKLRFEYLYDFGDSWQHDVVFEKALAGEDVPDCPTCVEGAQACPPEDCGGVWGYMSFLEAIRDKSNERHAEMLEWAGGEFDPQAFDAKAATRDMRRGLLDWRRMM